MTVVVVAPPSGDLVPLALVKQHLRVEHSDHDELIQDYIGAACAWMDGPAGWLGLALGVQTLRLDRSGFGDCDGILLSCGPVRSIETISYRGWGGVAVDVDAAVFELDPDTNRVRLVSGAAWPSVGPSPVSITYIAGYPDAGLPAQIRNAILLHVTILYSQPEGARLAALEQSRDALLSPVRRWSV